MQWTELNWLKTLMKGSCDDSNKPSSSLKAGIYLNNIFEEEYNFTINIHYKM
jgi:hypothetical protein